MAGVLAPAETSDDLAQPPPRALNRSIRSEPSCWLEAASALRAVVETGLASHSDPTGQEWDGTQPAGLR